MSDVAIGTVAFGLTISAVSWARAYTVVRLATIRASLNPSPQEFVMMEKAAQPRKIKAAKNPAPTPYGL